MALDAAIEMEMTAPDLSAAVLGEGLDPVAEDHLRAAAHAYDQDDVALKHLMEARLLAPTHPATLIGLYRFFFYKGRLEEALSVAQTCLTRAAIDNSLPLDWRATTPADAAFGDFGAVGPRFFMFALKGYAYLSMRLGDLDESAAAIDKLFELDPSDKVGAGVLRDVLARRGLDDVD
jgi:tetratricopeptide (TPR) repeat protein